MITVIPREERKEGTGSLSKEITVQIFSDLKKKLDIQTHDAKNNYLINAKRPS